MSNKKNYSIISLSKLAVVSKIEYAKIRNNLKGVYGSMTENEKNQLVNALLEQLKDFGDAMEVKFSAKKN